MKNKLGRLDCLIVVCAVSLAATSSRAVNLSSTSAVGIETGTLNGNAVYSVSTFAPSNGAGSRSLAVLDYSNTSDAAFKTDAVFSGFTSFTLAGWIKLIGAGGRIMSTGGGGRRWIRSLSKRG